MNSSTTPDFWKCFYALPKEIQTQAKKKYFLWKKNPRHPSVRFKKVGTLWSVRIDENYRALSLKESDIFYWFWIGNHENYIKLITGH